jgi:hypothetical protein
LVRTQTDEQINQNIEDFTDKMGIFMNQCADQVETAAQECMSVVREYNTKIQQLQATHGQIINKYTAVQEEEEEEEEDIDEDLPGMINDMGPICTGDLCPLPPSRQQSDPDEFVPGGIEFAPRNSGENENENENDDPHQMPNDAVQINDSPIDENTHEEEED